MVPTEEPSSLRRLGGLLRPFAWTLTGTLLLLVGLAVVNMVKPAFIKVIVDEVLPNRRTGLLVAILAGVLLVYLIRNAFYFLSKYAAVSVGEQVCFDLRNRLFNHLQGMSMQFYRENRPGQISSRLMDDTFVVQTFIQEDLPKLLQALMLFCGLLAVIYAVDWPLALASTVVLPIHLWVFYRFKGTIKASSRDAQERLACVHGNLIEKFLGMEVVKGFTAEDREKDFFQETTDLSRRSQVRSKTYHVLQKVTADLLVGLGTILLIGFGAWQVMQPEGMQVGTFLMFFGYVGMLYPTVIELTSGFSKFTRCTASVDRVFEILETEQNEQQEADHEAPITGMIEFERVGFSFGDGAPVLRDLSFRLEAGEVLAIVGPSGAGKSTLCSLIPRFIEPTLGRVMIDGVPATRIPLHRLRSAVGIAFQEAFLFDSTILENLRYARPDASMARIVDMARRTGADEFIRRLPEGYHTRLGAAGITLSRGEKQRITLARALVKDPQILILDEATASIDAEGEAKILPAVLEQMAGKTTLLVTHRLDMIRHADRVLALEEGRLIYNGTPMDLAERSQRQEPTPLAKLGEALTAPEEHAALGSGLWRLLQVLLITATLLLGGAVAAEKGPEGGGGGEAPPAQAGDDSGPGGGEGAAEAADPEAGQPREPASLAVPGAGTLIARPGAGIEALESQIEVLAARIETALAYEYAADSTPLPPPPSQTERVRTLVRRAAGATRWLRLGIRPFEGQALHLWLHGVVRTAENGAEVNPDLEKVRELLAAEEEARRARQAERTLAELASEKIRLSYVEVNRALAMLKAMGYNVVEFKGGGKSPGTGEIINPDSPPDLTHLPVVVGVPGTDSSGRVGEKQPATATGALMELVVFYDPGKPEQLGRLQKILRETVDVAARQIVIEAMVLEISETGLEKLGVEWELEPTGSNAFDNVSNLSFGSLPNFRPGESSTFDLELTNLFGQFRAQIQALVRTGDAEVLSRPSVLTLNNRQAYIRVGEDIPIATSVAGLRSGDKLNFNFRYLETGIKLNVRPRVSSDEREISMQIHGTVSAEVPGEDLEIFDNNGNVLARAPTLSQRQVQTYTRIANNTPFIIGGLVSKENRTTEDKVPFLGDVPLLGELFKQRSTDRLKREVIIVITPYVLPEEHAVGRNLPKDEDAFDSFGNELFRDAYRIRSEDVFDLSFLTENRRLHRAQKQVERILNENPNLRSAKPFRSFADDSIPGERFLVYRQMYEVLKRLEIDQKVNPHRMILFEPDPALDRGFSVSFLPGILEAHGVWDAEEGFREQALAITFTRQPEGDAEAIMNQPVPEIRVIDCPDRATWSRKLWELNQPAANGDVRHTVLIRDPEDVVRLQRALALKRTVALNATRGSLTLENFSVGRQLFVPVLKPDRAHVVDEEAARYFFLTEQYYPALQKRLDEAIRHLDRALERIEAGESIRKPHAPAQEKENHSASPGDR